MSKIVRHIELPINASTATTQANYATVFVSASSIYFTNNSGQTFDLTKSTAYSRTLYFTGSADRTDITYQWSPLPGLRYLEVCAIGAGGGGGAGAAVNSNFQQGGAGGGGGAIIWATYPSFLLTDVTYYIGIQRGGAGGSGSATSGIPGTGADGTGGGTSSFYDTSGKILVLADGGNGGPGGAGANVKVAAGGYVSQSIPPWTGLNGCPGGFVENVIDIVTIPSATDIFNNSTTIRSNAQFGEWGFGGGGGGTGAGISASLLAPAGSGSDGYQYNTIRINNNSGTSFPGANGSHGGAGTNNLITTLLRVSGSVESQYGAGGGGHGGGSSLVAGGNGGNGGFYGAGGGGGGSGWQLSGVGGIGGSGSAGLVILTEYYF